MPRFNILNVTWNRSKISEQHWRKLRVEQCANQNDRCIICNRAVDESTWHMHHINGKPLDNRMRNLIVVHKDCHKLLHSDQAILPQFARRFPRLAFYKAKLPADTGFD